MPVQLFVDPGKHTEVISVYGGSFRIEDTQINEGGRIQPQRGTARPPGELENILQNTSEPVVSSCEDVAISLEVGLHSFCVTFPLAFHYLHCLRKPLDITKAELPSPPSSHPHCGLRPAFSTGCPSAPGIISLGYFPGSENMAAFRCGLQILFEMLPGQGLNYQKSFPNKSLE